MLSDIATQMPKVVSEFCEYGIHYKVIEDLNNMELVPSCLKLLNRLCITDHIYVTQMINSGLILHLLKLLDSDNTVDALHVLSKFTDRSPDEVLILLPNNFVDQIIELGKFSPFCILKEVVYFLTIIIKNLDQDNSDKMIRQDVIELLVDMLSSGQQQIQLYCLEAFTKLLHDSEVSGKSQLYASFLDETDIFDELHDLGENRLKTVSDRAVSLTKKLTAIF